MEHKSRRIAFMGTPPFAAQALQALHDAGHDIVCVYSQPPRPAGRGKAPRKTAVHELAEKLSIEVRTPASLKGEEEQQAFRDLNLDVAVVAAYGLILPQAILDTPEFGCLNIHASLLPRWRGAAPIERAILAGDEKTGICIMQMEAGLDTGPVLLQAETPITAQDTGQSLHDRLAEMGAALIVDALARLEDLEPKVQDDSLATYASKIDKGEARLDFSKNAQELDRVIRAFNPRPGAFFELNGERIKILQAEVLDESGEAGTLLDDAFTIGCGEGAIRPLLLQRAGKKAMRLEEVLRGFSVPKNTVLG